MKSLLSFILSLFIVIGGFSQNNKGGKIIEQKFLAASIQGNHGGEDPMRSVTIYLPPGYESGNQRYPTIYFLHGFGADDRRVITETHFNELLDTAILSGRIRPVILVAPNSRTHFRGSFYSNSTLTGNWADFIGTDLVEYIDKNFRTLPNRNSRGLTGHSMGGHGALKVGMLFPDIFGSVYAMSPAVLNWAEEININSPSFKIIASAKSEEVVSNNFLTLVLTSLARTYSPNEQKPPFYANLPVYYVGDSMVVNGSVVKEWEANFPINMIENHLTALKSLNALKLDWGRNDEFPHIPVTCLEFSKKLETYGVHHFAEEYVGTHGDKLAGRDGRIYTEMLPFFDTYLVSENKSGQGRKVKEKRKTN